MQRALRLALEINIREIMIPWNNVVGVPASISNDGFANCWCGGIAFRGDCRCWGGSTTEVLGIMDVLDVLDGVGDAGSAGWAAGQLGRGGLNCGIQRRLVMKPRPAACRRFVCWIMLHPAMTLIGEQSVRSAITLMQRGARQNGGDGGG